MPEGFVISSYTASSSKQSAGCDNSNEPDGAQQPHRPLSARAGGRFTRTSLHQLPQLQQQLQSSARQMQQQLESNMRDSPGMREPARSVTPSMPSQIRDSPGAIYPPRSVSETVSKLGDDAGRGLIQNISPASMSTRCSPLGFYSPSPADVTTVVNDAEMWRRCFLTEANDCINSLKDVFESANSAHFSSRFEDWRKADLKATAQIQHHVKQLMLLNDSLADFLEACSTPEEFTKFKSALMTINECVDKLTTFGRELNKSIDEVARSASIVVVDAWQVEAKAASDLLQRTVRSQNELWDRDAAWHQDINGRLSGLQASVEKLSQEVQSQQEQVVNLANVQKEISDATQTFLKGTVEDLRAVTRDSVAQLTDTLREHATSDLQNFKSYLQDVLSGRADGAHSPDSRADDAGSESGKTPVANWSQPPQLSYGGDWSPAPAPGELEVLRRASGGGLGLEPGESTIVESTRVEISGRTAIFPSVRHALSAVEDRLHRWESISQKQVEESRDKAKRLDGELKDMTDRMRQWKQSSNEAGAENTHLHQEITNLRRSLEDTKGLLERAKSSSLVKSMKRLRDIESRGRVIINRQNGMLTLSNPVVFVMPTQADPNPQPPFENASVVETAICDVAEVGQMFQVPLKIDVSAKPPRGANMQIWDVIVNQRADALRAEVMRRGIPQELIITAAQAGPSMDDNVKLQFDKELFALPQKKRGNSPGRGRGK